jgi:putative ABC transport system permease protein
VIASPGQEPPQPPRLAHALVFRLLPVREREFLLGDLEEAFQARAAGPGGVSAARRWYWRASLASLVALRRRDRAEWRPHVPRIKGDSVMKNILRDVRQGARLLWRAPGFTILAVLTLALGIGANSAIFSVTYAILLKPLPYSQPEELALITENNLSRGWASFSVSPANFLDWRAQTSSFATLAAYGSRTFNYSGSGTPERLRSLAGTHGFLEMLDGTALHGRLFRPDEFEPGKDHVVVLSHGFWQRAFGGRTDVINQSMTLNGEPYIIVGVMHDRWKFSARDLSLFVPRSMAAGEQTARGAHYLGVAGRLKPGVAVETARTELTTLAARLESQYPDTNKGWSVNVTSLHDAVVGGFRPMLAVLLGAVGLVLLVACANLANMHLARATGRAREIAIRAAIGAGRLRIVQQLLTESLVLACAGGALGLLLAYWATSSFVAAYPTLLPRSGDIGVDPVVLMFTAGLCLATALAFGLAPAVGAARAEFNDMLKDGARAGAGRVRTIMRSGLVVTEVALALVLLAGAGILIRSFSQLAQVNPGFETDHRLSAFTILPQPKYEDPARIVDFFERVTADVAGAPGVQGVALASMVPIGGSDEIYSIEFEGRPPFPPGQGVSALYYSVSPDYFTLMGIPLLKGRAFTRSDRAGAPRVAMVSDTFVKLHFPNDDPIGKRIRIGRNGSIVREIVGVVGDVKHYALTDKPTAQVYEPFLQAPAAAMAMLVNTGNDPETFASTVRASVARIDPDQPVARIITLDQLLSDAGALPRVQAVLMASLGGIALLLAAVGLYGVMAYSVSQRTQEIGIRMTLGADRGTVMGMVLRQAALLTGLGLAIGLAGAVVLGRVLTTVLEPMLFDVKPTDGATLTAVAVVLAVVALVAAVIPARRATRIDPIQALREA